MSSNPQGAAVEISPQAYARTGGALYLVVALFPLGNAEYLRAFEYWDQVLRQVLRIGCCGQVAERCSCSLRLRRLPSQARAAERAAGEQLGLPQPGEALSRGQITPRTLLLAFVRRPAIVVIRHRRPPRSMPRVR